MYLNPLTMDQRHVFHEQAENPFPLSRFDGRITPEPREIRGQGEQLLPHLRIYQQPLLLGLALILLLRFGQGTELVIPFRFQTVGHQPIVRVDLHVTTSRQFGLVVAPDRRASGAGHRFR